MLHDGNCLDEIARPNGVDREPIGQPLDKLLLGASDMPVSEHHPDSEDEGGFAKRR